MFYGNTASPLLTQMKNPVYLVLMRKLSCSAFKLSVKKQFPILWGGRPARPQHTI